MRKLWMSRVENQKIRYRNRRVRNRDSGAGMTNEVDEKINVQSLMASVSESQVFDSTLVWYLSITKSRSLRAIIITWCCYKLQQLLPAIRQISREFIFQAAQSYGAQGNWDNKLFTRYFVICRPILKIPSRQVPSVAQWSKHSGAHVQ